MNGFLRRCVVWFRERLGFCAAALSVGVVSLIGSSVSAAPGDPVEVNIAPPNINWSSIPTSLMSVLTSPIVVGIGIALSIWAVFQAMKFFRRSAA